MNQKPTDLTNASANDNRWQAQVLAYEAALAQGKPPPEITSHGLPNEEQQRIANGCLAVDALRAAFNSTPKTNDEPTPRMLGDFRIIREVGRGGMGVVYEAEQISLGRGVALKLLPFAAMLDERMLARFKRESQAAASLHQDHIVPVFGVGCERGTHYYVMQFINGFTLADLIYAMDDDKRQLVNAVPSQQNTETAPKNYSSHPYTTGVNATSDSDQSSPSLIGSGTIPGCQAAASETIRQVAGEISTQRGAQPGSYFRRIAQLGCVAAEALHYAHQHGVLHRDIKPGNLMLDTTGKLWITDFGLAQMETCDDVTMTGDLVGTLRYMSPEQIRGEQAYIGPRTDVYSLGATLYELLTLRPAVRAKERQHVLREILENEPLPLRKICSNIPADLETIVLKTLEKRPEDRYTTAVDLVADLRSFLEDKPIAAKPVSTYRRFSKWTIRHHALVLTSLGLLSLLAIALLISAGLLNSAYRAQRQQREAVEQQRQLAENSVEELRKNVYAADLRIAMDAWQHRQFELLKQKLSTYGRNSPQAHLRTFPWYFLNRRIPPAIATISAHKGIVRAAVFGSSDQQLISAGEDGAVHFFQLGAGSTLESLPTTQFDYQHTAIVHHLACSADGKWVASACEDGVLGIRSTCDAAHAVSFMSLSINSLFRLVFSSTGEQLAVGDEQGTIYLVDIHRRSVTTSWHAHDGRVRALYFSPDGSKLGSGGDDGKACLWSVPTGKLLRRFEQPQETRRVSAVAIVDGANHLVTVSREGRQIRLFDANSGHLLKEHQLAGEVLEGLAISADQEQYVCVCKDSSLRILDRQSGWEMQSIPSLVGRPFHAQFSATGNRLVLAGESGEIVVHDVSDLIHNPQLMQSQSAHTDCSFSADGRWLAAVTRNGRIDAWDTKTGRLQLSKALTIQVTDIRPHAVNLLALSAQDGRLVVGGHGLRQVEVWDLPERRYITSIPIQAAEIDISPDGQEVATAGDERICFWDARTGNLRHEIPTLRSTHGDIAYSPDGRFVAIEARDKQLTILHAQDKTEVITLTIVPAITSWKYSQTGRLLAVSRSRHDCLLFETETWQQVGSLIGHTSDVLDLAFDFKDKTLATVAKDHSLRFWDLRSGQSIGLMAVKSPVAVSFSAHTGHFVCLSDPRNGEPSVLLSFSAIETEPLQLELPAN